MRTRNPSDLNGPLMASFEAFQEMSSGEEGVSVQRERVLADIDSNIGQEVKNRIPSLSKGAGHESVHFSTLYLAGHLAS